MTKKETPELRSQHSYGKNDRDGFIHRSWMKSQGLPDHVFDGRPVIGICNTWSELTPCNAHLRELAEHTKRGVWEAGGLPLEFPVMSLGETQMRPTAMLFRNLLAMEVEESIRGNPMDGVVLLGGCDKTTPAQVMGACSVGLPFLVVSSGPMLNGKFKGRDIGSGTDVWKFSEAVRAGEMSQDDFFSAERCMTRSHGTCMTMGTASTMACLVETMGLSLPYNGTIPAVDAQRKALAHQSGRCIVQMVQHQLTPEKVLNRKSFENAIVTTAALGGSTNSVLHLLAIAGRLGESLSLQDWETLGHAIPLLVDLMPSGAFLMEDFHYAGGMPALLHELRAKLHLDAMTITGKPLGAQLEESENHNPALIRPYTQPLQKNAGMKLLRGNLCPQGALIKPSAATTRLLKHRGRAVVFSCIEDYRQRINDPALPVDKDSVLVLQGCGPKGYPGMPEVGNMPLPPKLLEAGIKDMVRLSDARMSGTAFGTVVLHIAPESAIGGPLAFVKEGDIIALDASQGTLHLEVSEAELASRRAKWQPPAPHMKRGYYWLYHEHVLQADKGVDLDFLVGKSGHHVTRESH